MILSEQFLYIRTYIRFPVMLYLSSLPSIFYKMLRFALLFRDIFLRSNFWLPRRIKRGNYNKLAVDCDYAPSFPIFPSTAHNHNLFLVGVYVVKEMYVPNIRGVGV